MSSGSDADWTAEEMMTVAASRALHDGAVCFVGIGLPSTAANLARRVHAPGLVLVYESGTLGAKPAFLPLSIGDGILAESADAVVGVVETFNYWLQPGRIDIGFLAGAQLDRFANINTTVIGDSYDAPRVRLPGAGGAPEIAASCREVLIVMRQSPRAFVERIDFVTSVGYGKGGDDRERHGFIGAGPTTVITDVGILEPDPETRELVLTHLHPGTTLADAQAATGWELVASPALEHTPPPTALELSTLRKLEWTKAGRSTAGVS
ncbi:MAG: CoA-transferase subunit beta [Actinobacteria bacterium]|nr:CoA-transferase subunit beta [Actinomycetota bacterium]